MRSLRVWIGFAVSAVFLYVAFRGQDPGEIWNSLQRANYWYLIPGLALYFTGVWVRSLRWAFLLRSVDRFSGRQLFPIVVIGYMANNVLPLRAGEFVRAYVLSNRTGLRKSTALATIAVERIFDGLTMLAFILIASISIGLTSEIRHLVLIASLIFSILLGGLIFVSADRARNWLLHQCLPRLPGKVGASSSRMADSFLSGLGILRRREDLMLVALTSVAAWVLEASMYAVLSEGFQLGIGPAAILLTTAAANLGTLIPSSPGYVGPFEAGVLIALVGAIGLQRELALSYAIAVHAALYFPVTFWGLYYWWRENLSWRKVQARLSTEDVGAD